MPIYEYQCAGCAQVFEVFQKHTDPPPTRHDCGSTDVRRVLSNTSFVLKGTGWYATDYGSRKDGDAAAKKRERGQQGDAGDGKDKAAAKGDKAAAPSAADKPATGARDGAEGGKKPPPKKGNGGGSAAA